MTLIAFLKTLPRPTRERFAISCGTSLRHMENVAYGKRCGEDLAIQIEKHSFGLVKCETLRPDVEWAVLRGTASRFVTNVHIVPSGDDLKSDAAQKESDTGT